LGDFHVDAEAGGVLDLHPTFLALVDDITRIVGQSLHNLNVEELKKLVHSLHHYAEVAPPAPPEPRPLKPQVVLDDLDDMNDYWYKDTPRIDLGDLGDDDDLGWGIGGIHR
jgi:hypothetical protein